MVMPQIDCPGATRLAPACWYGAGRGDGTYLGTASSQLAPNGQVAYYAFPSGAGVRYAPGPRRHAPRSCPVKPQRAQSNPTRPS